MTPRKPVKVRSTVRTLVVDYEGDDPVAAVQVAISLARNLGFKTPAAPAAPEQPEGGAGQ